MVAHVVATEIFTELEGVISVRPREVVDELVLGDVAALRERLAAPAFGLVKLYGPESSLKACAKLNVAAACGAVNCAT